MGERSFDFSTIADRAAKSGTCIYRAAWRIEPGTVMTDEPGLLANTPRGSAVTARTTAVASVIHFLFFMQILL